MKTLFLFSTLLFISTQTFAENRSIYIPSSTMPDHIPPEQFNALLMDHAKTTQPEKSVQDVKKPLKPISYALNEEDAKKKAEAKKIASTAKRDFEHKIKRAWDTPPGSSGKTAIARVILSKTGAVQAVIVSSSDPDMKASIEAAVRAAAPYPMPSDPDARREAQSFTSTFRSSN